MTFHASDARPIHVLKERYGEDIVLQGHQHEDVVHRIVAEFGLGDRLYAVLRSERQLQDEEVDIYRITVLPDGEPELETIDDDDEWEDVFDVYDELTYHFDDEA